MSLTNFTMKDLLSAGVHFGHHPRRWNPKMERHIFGVRNGVHVINLEHTYPMMRVALDAIQEIIGAGGRALFVGTKRQAAPYIAETAQKTGQFFVNHRWLGGMLTNWKTISRSILRLKELEVLLDSEESDLTGYTKKELLKLTTHRAKLETVLGGIKDMGGLPDVVIVFDASKEKIAVDEAHNLGIPVVGIVDTNCDPTSVDYPIPGNDDARRSIEFYCRMFTGAVLEGLQIQMAKSGVDLGARDFQNDEDLFDEPESSKNNISSAKTAAKKVSDAPVANITPKVLDETVKVAASAVASKKK